LAAAAEGCVQAMLARQAEPSRHQRDILPAIGASGVARPITLYGQLLTDFIGQPREEISTVGQDINVLALVKGAERYVFLYNDANRAETLRTLGRFASNPELSFTWYDAAVLSQRIRQDSHKFVCNSRFSVPTATESEEY
jgi:hypothetical protein